ncbi:Aspartate-semialdehyde dehydrogenase Acd [Methanonatronarchaeum thermophilum]|uniref:Aspartate-semialdehyde dehydrogenase n=1 Tax=Methanonatronarchaeum thermophilum TaxID=1927129 RepID=A0A1Y3GCN5_9EURY|nr:aspartate-semialdehyde dehydrogenase [Methanonatronarchaeum thermophilum]OUJ19007.1 Aspartate-semialdehyde dehydrogenase Acd [Methanonatronarchaeum thermophilum]
MNLDVGVIGATGMVGQRFISLLTDHPWFNLTALAASERSAGKKYSEAANWVLDTEMPESVRDIEVVETQPGFEADIIFSALPSNIAREVEPKFAEQGYTVASNASAYRMAEDVPLLIPEVNPEHIDLIDIQRENRGWDGAIITNPNCSSIILTLPVTPIAREFGIKNLRVATLQAVSGAGYTGVPSMAIVDNVIPYIGGEEDKVETEIQKMLGDLQNGEIKHKDFKIKATCNRVPVIDGHLENLWIELEEKPELEEIKKTMNNFQGEPQKLDLPTAPKQPVIVREENDRPQSRLDRNKQKGMAVTAGRIRGDEEIQMTILGHNTIRGAAGASILNAELLAKKQKI